MTQIPSTNNSKHLLRVVSVIHGKNLNKSSLIKVGRLFSYMEESLHLSLSQKMKNSEVSLFMLASLKFLMKIKIRQNTAQKMVQSFITLIGVMMLLITILINTLALSLRLVVTLALSLRSTSKNPKSLFNFLLLWHTTSCFVCNHTTSCSMPSFLSKILGLFYPFSFYTTTSCVHKFLL